MRLSVQPTPERQPVEALTRDSIMRALATATPAEVDAWLAANVKTIADSRRVLAVLLQVARLYLQDRAGK